MKGEYHKSYYQVPVDMSFDDAAHKFGHYGKD